jgi:hypothetical protein
MWAVGILSTLIKEAIHTSAPYTKDRIETEIRMNYNKYIPIPKGYDFDRGFDLHVKDIQHTGAGRYQVYVQYRLTNLNGITEEHSKLISFS